MNCSQNAKVLLPCQPFFFLELVDFLCEKIARDVKIIVISEAAKSVVEYANINLEYLNTKLQDKIYETKNPLSIDKLFKDKRLAIFPSV